MNKTKKAIFQSAISVFSNRGYNGATMDEIASNAGVAKGTLYYHFKSKEEIFNYIITEGMQMLKEEIEEVANREEDAITRLKNLCKVQLSIVFNNRDFFKVIMSQLWGQEIRQLELRKVIEKYITRIETYIQDAMDKGVIKRGEPSFMAYTFFGTLCSTAVYELLDKDKRDVDEVINSMIEYILNGIEVK